MAWKETCPVDQRVVFMAAVKAGEKPIAELCDEFEISRKTAYKWIARYEEGGPAALVDRSRTPLTSPRATSKEIVSLLVDVRKRHPRWGPKKIIGWLRARAPALELPAPSTCGALLKRLGMVVARKRRRSCMGEEKTQGTRPPYAAPNAVWCADFKGWFRTKDGVKCHPLTITDGYSRMLIRVEAVLKPDLGHSWPIFEDAFREYGLPFAIRTDNGPPFGARSLHGLSRLGVKLLRLGIWPDLIEPGHPEQNGRHERMHRTLKDETARPPQRNLRAQKIAFGHFQEEFNHDRPHEALGLKTPASMYTPSPRPYPRRLQPLEYPSGNRVYKVLDDGHVRWHSQQRIYVSQAFAGEYLGFEQISERSWNVYFDSYLLATLDARAGLRLNPVPLVRPSWGKPGCLPAASPFGIEEKCPTT